MASTPKPIVDDAKSSLLVNHILMDYFERWSKADSAAKGKFKDGTEWGKYLKYMKYTVYKSYLKDNGEAKDDVKVEDIPFMFLPNDLKELDTYGTTVKIAEVKKQYEDAINDKNPNGGLSKIQSLYDKISPKMWDSAASSGTGAIAGDLKEFKEFWDKQGGTPTTNVIQEGTKELIMAYATRFGIPEADMTTGTSWSGGNVKDNIFTGLAALSALDWFQGSNDFEKP